MEGGVGRVGEPGGIIGGFEPNGVENWERMEVIWRIGRRCVEIDGEVGNWRMREAGRGKLGEVGEFGGVVLRLLGRRGFGG